MLVMSETGPPRKMKDAQPCMTCSAAALCMQMLIQGMRELWASVVCFIQNREGSMTQVLNVLCSL